MIRKYFKILAPFTQAEDIRLLKEAGADELYCGYITVDLLEKWPAAFNIINRRGEEHSFDDYNAFKKATEQADKYNLPVYVTINGLYTLEQYHYLLDLVEKIERLQGVKGIIIADLGFLILLRKNKFKKEIHISTGGTCFNSYTADFFHNLGANRIILDRQLTSYEIRNLIEGIKSQIDIEIFIIREGCGGFIDGYCTFSHCDERNKIFMIKKRLSMSTTYNLNQQQRGCVYYFQDRLINGQFRILSVGSNKEVAKSKFKVKIPPLYGCRICDLYELMNYPIKSLKIVGRGKEASDIAKSVKLISEALFLLENNDISEINYKRKCRKLFSSMVFDSKRWCTKFDCYFSPHWIKNGK